MKNLRISPEEVEAQKENLHALDFVENLLAFCRENESTVSYFVQAEMVLGTDHEWANHAQETRKKLIEQLSADRDGHISAEYRQTLDELKKKYVATYVELHGKARLGLSEDGTKTSLQKDSRLVALRSLAGISLMPTSQLARIEEELSRLKICTTLIESELAASPFCPHCNYHPASEQGEPLPAVNVLKQFDGELDRLHEAWTKAILDNLDDPVVRSNLNLVKETSRKILIEFEKTKAIPDVVTPEFVEAIQEALSGLERVDVSADDILHALFDGGSPSSIDELRTRFDAFLDERSKGKNAANLRFVVERVSHDRLD